MTSITLRVNGASACASVTGPLTSGMVGVPVTIEYDEAWNGLIKHLVCRCSPGGPDSGESRVILNVEGTATVPHEAMKPDMHLYLGVEGFSEKGKLVVPTTWAECGIIYPGANADGDLAADPALPVWDQLQAQIEQIKQDGINQEQLADIQADVQAARTAAEAAAERAEEAVALGQNAALTTAQVNALDGMLKVCAFVKPDVSAEYQAFRTAFGLTGSGDDGGEDGGDTTGKTLTSISAAYSGGTVAAGTAVSALSGVVVTAHYSDGSTATVTGYTLSGTIAEGSNTITVSYGGKTATFTVTGTAESGGEETGVSNETAWASGVAYTFEPIPGSYPDKSTGVITDYNNWARSPYLYCAGASTLRGVVKHQSSIFSGSKDNAFYDADKNYVAPVGGATSFSFASLANAEVGTFVDIPIPENAAYVIISGGSGLLTGTSASNNEPLIEYVPYE